MKSVMHDNECGLEIDQGERFAFGENWRRFLRTLDDERVQIAVSCMREMLEIDRLDGKSFLGKV